MYYLYIVQCRDNTLYTGTARDLNARIEKHNSGKLARYTRDRCPVKLVYSEALESKGEALRREHEIKKLPRFRKLMLIKSENSIP
jgi:putative endonuclease